MTADGPLRRLLGLRAAAGTTDLEAQTSGRANALGWATVELDRAALELGHALGIPPEAFVVSTETLALGARCRLATGVLPDELSLVLLEPVTEGRLASTLARRDEGPAAVWLVVDDLPIAIAALQERGGNASHARSGPFGDECLVLDRPRHGPHLLLVERPGTIRS